MQPPEDKPKPVSTAIWVAQLLSSVTDRIEAALHVLPAPVQTVLQDGADPPADLYHRMPPTRTLPSKPGGGDGDRGDGGKAGREGDGGGVGGGGRVQGQIDGFVCVSGTVAQLNPPAANDV